MNERHILDNKYERYLQIPIYMIPLFVIMVIAVFTCNVVAGFIVLGVSVAYAVVTILAFIKYKTSINDSYVEFVMEHGRMQKELLKELPIPYALITENGRFMWVNDEFSKITETSKRKLLRLSIPQIFDGITLDMIPEESGITNSEMSYNDREYKVEIKRVIAAKNTLGALGNEQEEEDEIVNELEQTRDTDRESFIAIYMFDITDINRCMQAYQDQKLIAGFIYLDNYDEVIDGLEEVRHSLLMALVDRKINKYMANVDGVVKALEKDKYMFVMPQKYLSQLRENKFAILDEIKAINIGNSIPLTLSISMGTDYNSFMKDFEAARSAMELALGRGGDQVVLKMDDKITYYGGKSQGTEKTTRVKARVKTLAFQELLEPKQRVIIMAHKDPDTDAFGSGIGVYRMVTAMNKDAHIVINKVSSAISPIYSNFAANSQYGEDMFINSTQAIEMMDSDTVLVIVDVNRPSYTECEELISYAKTVVVFDHHRQTKEVVSNATLSYIEPFASSACEMIAEMLQYMDENVKLKPMEADAMYAGILIDTDNFLTKTGVRTFEAAAYLRRCGADVMRVRKLFRSDIDAYKQKADGVRNAEMVLGAFAVSIFKPTEEGNESPVVLTAKVANELLNVAGVKASFVLTQIGTGVRISARAIDEVNVQIIMERLGGGGHATVAGVQLENTTTLEAKQKLVDLLEEMYKEGDI